MTETILRNVSDTAHWVAIYRAMESERQDALFRDPFARQLGGQRGEDILRVMPRGAATAWPMIVRTQIFDEILLSHLDPTSDEPVDTVLNLAAGLDARPYRLPLPPTLRWVEADLPDILEYKESILGSQKPCCNLERFRVDLSQEGPRREFFQRLGESSRRVFVITEGLIVYLAPDAVSGLARDLASQPTFHWWLTDVASPDLLKRMNKVWGKVLEAAQAPFRFGPLEGVEFFKSYGWQARDIHPIWDEARRLRRQPKGAWFFEMMARVMPAKAREKMRRLSQFVLFENTHTRHS
jgi:methyltransferase (TIGR00027 family)